MKPILFLLTLLGLAGCASVGPDYRAPAPALPAAWAAPAPAGAPALQAWWRELGDPALNTLVADALASSPDVRAAQARLREARARFGAARAERLPSLDQAASVQRSESAGAGAASDSYRLGLDASWELDLFGGTRRAVEAAQATLEASAASLADARLALAAELVQGWLDLATQRERLAVARANLASQEASTALTGWRWQAGLVSELDYAQARATVAQTRARIPVLLAAIEADLNALAVLSGLPRAEVLARSAPLQAIPPLPPTPAAGVPADLLRQRPDVRAAERRLAAATANVGVVTARLYPALKLSGSVGWSAADLPLLLRADTLASSLAASLATPLFDGGRIRQAIAVQDALVEQALIAWEKTLAQAQADVENALVALARGRERVQALDAAREAAQLAARQAQQRHAAGLIDSTTLEEVQRTLLAVEDSHASARGDAARALVQLCKALGAAAAPALEPVP